LRHFLDGSTSSPVAVIAAIAGGTPTRWDGESGFGDPIPYALSAARVLVGFW